jgi:hypothetical protein
MATSIESLFGVTPEDLMASRQLQAQKEALTFAQLTPQGRVAMGGYMAGRQLGGAFGGLLGAEDPELARIRQRQSLVQGLDLNDPKSLRDAASRALQAGDPSAASVLVARATEAEKALSEAEKARADLVATQALTAQRLRERAAASLPEKVFSALAAKSTPKSVQAAIDAGNDISLLEIPETDKLSTIGLQLVEAGYVRGSPEFQAKMKEILEAEKTGRAKGTGNVNIGTIDVRTGTPGVQADPRKAAEAAGKKVGEDIALIEGKYSALDNISEALDKLDKGIFSGTYGPTLMAAAKATSSNNPKVVRTEEFLSYIGEVVIPRLQEFGGNDSVEELKYLQKVMGGEQRLESESLRRILLNAERKIRRGIERTQRQSTSAATGTPAPLDPGPARQRAPGPVRNFRSVQEAEAANLPKGTEIIINGRRAIVE